MMKVQVGQRVKFYWAGDTITGKVTAIEVLSMTGGEQRFVTVENDEASYAYIPEKMTVTLPRFKVGDHVQSRPGMILGIVGEVTSIIPSSHGREPQYAIRRESDGLTRDYYESELEVTPEPADELTALRRFRSEVEEILASDKDVVVKLVRIRSVMDRVTSRP